MAYLLEILAELDELGIKFFREHHSHGCASPILSPLWYRFGVHRFRLHEFLTRVGIQQPDFLSDYLLEGLSYFQQFQVILVLLAELG